MQKVSLFGVPRSGTTWLSQIFNSHPDVILRFQPLFSYGHKGRLSEHSSAAEIRSFFDEILHSQDPLALMATEMQKNYPAFKKSGRPTHVVFKETRYLHIIENLLVQCNDVKIIGIVRNPLAVLASWMQAPKEFSGVWNIHEEWRRAPEKNQNKAEEFYGFEKWREATEMFLRLQQQYSKQFMLLGYDELNTAPLETTKRMFEFCGLAIEDQVQEFLVMSKSRHDTDPYSVFRSKANDEGWRGVLPEDIVRNIGSELKHTPLEIFLEGAAHA